MDKKWHLHLVSLFHNLTGSLYLLDFSDFFESLATTSIITTLIIKKHVFLDHVKHYVDNLFVTCQNKWNLEVILSAIKSISSLKPCQRGKNKRRKENKHVMLHTLKATTDARIAYRLCNSPPS